MSTKVILLLEQDPQRRRVHAELLRFVGFRVLEASDVGDAEGWMREGEPDLLVVEEAALRSSEGSDLTAIGKALGTRSTPALALTREDWSEDRLQRAGYCGQLRSPFSLFRIVREVERCLGPMDEDLLTSGGRSSAVSTR